MRGSLVLALLIFGLLASCAVDDAANPGERCSTSADCPDPETMSCYRGFCILGEGGECNEEGMTVRCYTGPEGTAMVGVCRQGERFCSQGRLSACLGQIVPPEMPIDPCNGLDDDCDGTVDEQPAVTCDVVGARGACAAGALTCRGSESVCDAVIDPLPETCDGVDEDCDGEVDEDVAITCYPPDTTGCVAQPDGTFACEGICAPGTQVCDGGALQACAGATAPVAGPDDCTPDGMLARDDDCDGVTDDDCTCSPGDMQDCYGGPVGTQAEGTCTAGTQVCGDDMRWGACAGELLPEAETCANPGEDNDCDGVVDNIPGLGDPCMNPDTGAMGICRSGTMQCTEGGLSCVTPEPAAMELCDGRDDDCDGTVDNGFDLLTDEANCGMCGAACGDGLTCCGGACVDTTTNPSACGDCGTTCGADIECCGGTCSDRETDPMNCGSCGNVCGAGRACCGGTCIDTLTNPAHCGGCAIECPSDQACCGGTCAPPDDPLCTACAACAEGESCCSGSCVDVTSDTAHCGGCGISCGVDELCCGGACVPNDATNCGMCGTTCGADQLCCGGDCVANNATNCNSCGNSCGSGQSCCTTGCIDTRSDVDNCGECGAPCDTGNCTNGVCCPAGLTGCDGSCVDTQSSHSHCGSCGNSCGTGSACCNGRCRLLSLGC